LPEDLEATIKAAAEISMGTEISDSDIAHIHSLCDQVIDIAAYRTQLAEYLRNRMTAIAPNLTALVGELVGARLISHAGSLLSLAKHPASTVQILGAEKALFRALKTKHDTPKYGLIYHASLIGQAPPKLKGKMARMVATKAALSIRVDALTDADSKSANDAPTIGLENRAKLESRLRALEHQSELGGVRRPPGAGPKQARAPIGSAPRTYNDAADAPALVPAQRDPVETAIAAVLDVKEEKRKAKEERRAKRRAEKEKAGSVGGMDVDDADSNDGEAEKKRKRRESAVDDIQMKVGRIRLPSVVSLPLHSLAFILAVARAAGDRRGAQGAQEGTQSREGCRRCRCRCRGWRVSRDRREEEKEEEGGLVLASPVVSASSSAVCHVHASCCLPCSIISCLYSCSLIRSYLKVLRTSASPKST
jgi:hypothetical protein